MKTDNAVTTTTAEPTDRTLISRYLKGDEQAFDMLYERYRKPVYGYLSGLFPGRFDMADEIYQQTWIKVIKNLSKYRDRNTFISWIIRIARNSAMDYFRRQSRFLPLEEAAIDNRDIKDDSPLHHLARNQEHQQLYDAIAQLPKEQREVVLLRLEDISFKEIAGIQKVSINTALGRMRYAVIALRDKLIIENSDSNSL